MTIDLRPTETGSTRTVERALALLSEVCDHEAITLTEAARGTDLPTSTALRLLRTMESLGFVDRAGNGSYAAGPRLLQLGAGALGRSTLVRLAEPALARVVALTGESVYLFVQGPHDSAVNLALAEGTYSVRHTSWAGRSVPRAGLAVGRALDGEVPAAGFVSGRDQLEPDVTAIAAPIWRIGGVAGALSILGPTYRLDEDRVAHYGRILVAETSALSRAFAVPTPLRQETGP
ncbi:MAG: helix-turn-helix domain-containing protein [Nostocoides sp.]